MSSRLLFSILTSSLLMVTSYPPTLALALPCRTDGVLPCENRMRTKCENGGTECENRVQTGCGNGGTECENREALCKNGGSRLKSGECLCPKPFYGDQCQKRFDISLMVILVDCITWKSGSLKEIIMKNLPLRYNTQFAFIDYSEFLSGWVIATAKLKLNLGYFKENMFDDFIKLINFPFVVYFMKILVASLHQEATKNLIVQFEITFSGNNIF